MKYYVRQSGDAEVEGPFSIEQVNRLVMEGHLNENSWATADLGEGSERIANSRESDWSKLIDIQGVTVLKTGDRVDSKTEEAGDEISLARRIRLLIVAWAATAVFTFPGVLLFPHLFPLGIFKVAGASEAVQSNHLWLICGWLFYSVLTCAAAFFRRGGFYFCIYLLLCFLLLLNSVGCRMIISELKGLH